MEAEAIGAGSFRRNKPRGGDVDVLIAPSEAVLRRGSQASGGVGVERFEEILPAVLARLHAMSAAELEARTARVLAARASHFSYDGTLEHVARFLLNDPARPSDLRCVPLPLTPSGH